MEKSLSPVCLLSQEWLLAPPKRKLLQSIKFAPHVTLLVYTDDVFLALRADLDHAVKSFKLIPLLALFYYFVRAKVQL